MTDIVQQNGRYIMKTHKVLLLALIVSAVLSVSAEAGKHDGNNGSQVAPARAHATAPTFRSASGGGGSRFSGGRMIAPSQRFSSIGMRSTPTSFRQRNISSRENASVGQRQFTPGTLSRGNRFARFENSRARDLGTIQGNRENRVGEIQNNRSERLGQFENRRGDLGTARNNRENRVGSIRNGNRSLTGAGASNHVFARRDADWHRDWDRHSDHWWNGHCCRFVNGCWFIFDLGFFPWYGYPYDYYAYDYYDPYSYGYDPGVYEGDNYYGQGTYDSYDQNADATVAAAQERLARQGYYRGQIDGVFGPETRRAIMRYQSDHGLGVTGYLTMETRQSLGLRQVARY